MKDTELKDGYELHIADKFGIVVKQPPNDKMDHEYIRENIFNIKNKQ